MMPTTTIGQLVVVTTPAGLRARRAPDGSQVISDGRPVTRPKGFTFRVTDREHAGGRWWVKATTHWYAEEFVRPHVQAGPPARIASPVPGLRPTTPWRKRPIGWPTAHTYWRARGYHTGTDYAAAAGVETVAVLPGVVQRRFDAVLGNVALLFAGNGRTYWYCHLSKYAVADGARVSAGQVIGYVGDTGSGARGPHLHLEAREGHTTSWTGPDLDPLDW